MEVLEGLFKSKNVYVQGDNYGGNYFRMYNYIYIYIYNNNITIFSSYKKYFVPSYDSKILDSFEDGETLKNLPQLIDKARKIGKIHTDNNPLVLSCNVKRSIIVNHVTEMIDDIQFFKIYFDNKLLKIQSWYESSANEIWLNDNFEWVDLDYVKLEKQIQIFNWA